MLASEFFPDAHVRDLMHVRPRARQLAIDLKRLDGLTAHALGDIWADQYDAEAGEVVNGRHLSGTRRAGWR